MEINKIEYELINNYKDSFKIEDAVKYLTPYFTIFDYVVGDYSSERLRLKGFFDSNNKLVKPYNDIKNLDEYFDKLCNYKAGHYVLKKKPKNANITIEKGVKNGGRKAS